MNARWVAAPSRSEALAALAIREVAHLCPRCGSTEHGRPFADGVVSLSLSHSGGLTLAATAETLVGIDHEPIGTVLQRDVVAHPSESGDALQLWVRKEAVLKATGLGLQIDPTSFWINDYGYVSPIAGYDGPELVVTDIAVDGFVAAIASTAQAVYLLP
ncbi:MAG: 4'-phosphopantetheinyl transferase family protein [Marmoricola sp.]